MLTVEVQLAVGGLQLPSEQDFTVWAQAAYLEGYKGSQVTVRVVNAEESRQLNKQYRHQDKPTNVLSFPMQLPEDIEPSILGDIVICADVVEREALEQEKNSVNHWAHMIVHGVLHLQGYDHIEDEDAEKMEALEVEILAKMGIKNPYLS